MGFQLPTSTGYPDSPAAKNAMGQHHAMTFFRFGNPKNPSQNDSLTIYHRKKHKKSP